MTKLDDGPVRIRAATMDDAARAARCHVACWREAYGPLVDPEVLRRVSDIDQRTRSWQQILAKEPPWLLAIRGRDVVGFAGAGPGRDDDLDVETELYAIYVRASEYDTGLGARLLRSSVGDNTAYLWVLEQNDRARRFYARSGFVSEGARKCDEWFGLWEVRLTRRSSRRIVSP